jgi:Tfp pilus assembly protein PilF
MEEIVAVLREDPNDAKAWYTAAQIFERAGQLDKAESALRRAVWLSPRADGWVHVARFAFNRGDSEVFEAALAQAESLDPQHGGVHIGRGLRLATEGKVQEALSEFVRAAEIDPIRSGAEAQARIEQLRAAHPAN